MGSQKLLRGRMLRATKLDGCGNPLLGPASQLATDGWITVGLTANNESGEQIQVTNAAGDMVVDDTPIPQFKNWSIEVTMVGVDPELYHLLTGQRLVLSADGSEVVGFRVNSKVKILNTGFALEMWTGVAGDLCVDGETSYGYMLIPFSQGGTIGDISVENGAINMIVTGALSQDGSDSGWGVGPYNVTRDEANAPGPLNDPIVAGDHLHTEKVTVAPPPNSDGAVPLGTQATGANSTTTTPATLTPANTYPPETLADAITGPFAATPNTAWATGKYVVLGDGSYAHWSGSTWVAGIA